MAKLKAEVLHQRYQNRPHPLGHLLLGHIFRLNPIASATAPLANRMLHNRAFKWLLEKAAGIDRRRTLPTFARDHFRRWFRRHVPAATAGNARRSRSARRLFHDLQRARGRDRDGAGARSRGLSRPPGRARVLRPAGDLQGAACRWRASLLGPTFESCFRSLAAELRFWAASQAAW